MKKFQVISSLVLAFCLLVATAGWAQDDPAKRPSPAATATGQVGDATVTVTYSSPSVKGRTVWGDLVPYGEVWRAGANEATTIHFSKDVTVEGQPLAAGTYTFFALPNEDEWTVIFNKATKQWGTQYDEAQDALRVTVTPTKASAFHEKLAYAVTDKGLVLQWENLEIPVAIE